MVTTTRFARLLVFAAALLLSFAGTAQAKPLVRIYVYSGEVGPRDGAIVAAHVSQRSSCALTLAHGRRHAGPFRAIVNGRYVVWTWSVPAKAAPGTWHARVTCRSAHRRRAVRVAIHVRGVRNGRAPLAHRSGMSTAVSDTPPGGRTSRGPQAGALGGKGGGNVCEDPSQPGSVLDQYGYCTGNCTHYVATRRPDLTYLGNAYEWRDAASNRLHIQSGPTPVVGSVAWWDRKDKRPGSHDYGHVAFVDAVSGSTYHVVEMNRREADGSGGYGKVSGRSFTLGQTGGGAPDAFIYGGPAAGGEYIGHIVHWNADPNQQKTAWLVILDGGHPRRNWIPNSATYSCLKAAGAPGPDELPADVLTNQLPDEKGVWAKCAGGRGGGAPPAPAPTAVPVPTASPPPAATPVPAPLAQTWSEQETPNHPVNTFSNYHSASGPGPQLAAGQWVQVSCKVYDPTITSVRPDGYWYRIASAPWNNAFYAPANTFMNGDPYGGPYTHNTDLAVPDC